MKKMGGYQFYDRAKSGQICYIKDGKNTRFKPEDQDEYEKHHYHSNRKAGANHDGLHGYASMRDIEFEVERCRF